MRAVRLLAPLTVLALVVGACGNSGDDDDTASKTTVAGETTAPPAEDDLTKNVPIDEIGVTDSEIRVSVITSATNPLGGKYKEFGDGVRAYFEMANSEGGIYGRQLTIAKERDDELANNQREVQGAIAEDNAFAVFIATLLFTGADDLAAERVPTYGWNINPEWSGPDHFFPNAGSLCLGCTGRGLPWLAREIGATKIGLLAYGVSPQSKLCAAGTRESFERYGSEVGAEMAFFDDTLPFGVTDLSAQVAAMKDAGVELVTTCMDQTGVFTLAQEMDKQGLDAIQHMPQGYDPAFIEANAQVFEGNYVVPQFTAFEHEPQPESMQQFFEWMGTIGKEPGELAMHGWIAALQFHDQLKAAGPEFDREKVIAAGNTMTAYTAEGLIVPIDWTRQHKDPTEDLENRGALICANTVQIQAGTFVPVFAEGDKPWVCFNGRSEEWEEPEHYSFVDFDPEAEPDSTSGTTGG